MPRADRAHEYVYRRLNNSGLTSVVNAGRTLHALRILRNKADYDVDRPLPSAALDAVSDAESILQILDGLTPTKRTQITDAMKLYEQQIGDVTWKP